MTININPNIFSTEKLNKWAGEKIVERGRKYQRDGCVEELALLPDGRIAAVVTGLLRYRVAVSFDENGPLDSDCTCSYEFDCKHAVAALFEYRHRLKNGQSVPLSADAKFNVFGRHDKPGAALDVSTLKAWLHDKTIGQLIALLLDICREHPAVAADLANRINVENGNTAALMREIRQEVGSLIEVPIWDNGHYVFPDYSGPLKKIEQLLPLGVADDLLNIMTNILEAVQKQIEHYHHDEEFTSVSRCYSTALTVLRASTLAPAQKLLWAIERILAEQYGFGDIFEQYLKERHPDDAWSKVADDLLDRLTAQKVIQDNENWERDHLSNFAIRALEEAGRHDEIIPLCERESKLTKSYERLVRNLMDAGRIEDAEQYIAQGVAATYKDSPGRASSLRRMRIQIYTDRQDWAKVLIHHVCEFVESPSENTYGEVKNIADTINAWPRLRAVLLQYLQTGALPWQQKSWEWPAPDQIELARNDRWKKSFPKFETLTAIAILENEAAEVIKWYDKFSNNRSYGRNPLDLEVAEAVKQHTPERSLLIWKSMAEAEIALTNPAAYQKAGEYLKKAGKLMKNLKRETQWHDYISNLRTANARKKRLMEVLDTLKD